MSAHRRMLAVFTASVALGVTAAASQTRGPGCTSVMMQGQRQTICDGKPVSTATASSVDVKVALPEAAPPVVTGAGKGLAASIALPEPPPATVVIDPKLLAGLAEPVREKAEAARPAPPPEPKVEIAVPETAPAEATFLPKDIAGLAEPPKPEPEAPRAIAIPEIPPADVVITPGDIAGLEPPKAEPPALVPVPPPPPAPPGPVLAIVPPPPPPVAPAPAPVVPETKQAEKPAIGPVPQDTVKAALQRLKAGNRLTDAEAAETLAFYETRGFAPLWIDGGQWGARAQRVRAKLAAAADDGLDPARYRSVAAFHAGSEPAWPALAAAEAQLTESLILYAREAATGRVRPQQVHELITPKLVSPSAKAVLTAVSAAADPVEALAAFHPPHQEFAVLRKALAEARANRPVATPGEPIPDGPALRIGMRDPRVPLIRARLGLGLDATPVYDRNVSIKVASLQKEAGLPVTGAFTPATRRALLGEGPSPEEAEIVANMEFWRWMPRTLGAEHIIVNAPAYDVKVVRNGAVIHQARAIIGKTDTQTPFFSDEMDHIVVNPSWYIPPGILKREPKYLNPEYAAARGYEVRTRGTVTTVRVPPGSSNALGYVKFMFPNDHAVYLHDTPNRRLFNATNRSLSNGCVRIENPFQLAALLFASEGWTEERFKRLIGGGERRMNLPRKIAIHLGYFTLTPDADGMLRKHPDVYGHGQRLKQLLGLS